MDNRLLLTIDSIISSSYALKQMIKIYFDRLDMTNENMSKIFLIFSSIHSIGMLADIEPYEYLEKSLEHIHSIDYSIKWFEYFLVKNNIEQSKCQQLVQRWIECIRKKSTGLIDVCKVLDRLLKNMNSNDWFWSYFIDYIIEICFQQDIFLIIKDSLINIQNRHFRDRFVTKFQKKYSVNSENALAELFKLDKQTAGKSLLIRDLISILSDQIEIPNDLLLQDTFFQPGKSTLIYRILFEEPFVNLPIHKKIIQRLIHFLADWDTEGFYVAEIQAWNTLHFDAHRIVLQIWRLIETNWKKTKHLEDMIAQANTRYNEIIRMKEKMSFCLDRYCENACDKEHYLDEIQHLQKQLAQQRINSIKIPGNWQIIKPYVEQLSTISKSHCWQQYLNEASFAMKHETSRTTLRLFEITYNILERFKIFINKFWIDPKQSHLHQLEQLFPEQNLIDFEFNQIKSLFDSSHLDTVELIVDYWKNREKIHDLSQACIDLHEQYQIKSTEKLIMFKKILQISQLTSFSTCLDIYREYCSNSYSKLTTSFLSEYHRSKELFVFLRSLTSSDIDNLLEVVNDWDETLINTKTIFEFVSLKSFFDQIDVSIERFGSTKTFNNIIDSLETVFKQKEFKSILNMIQSCSSSLSSIKHIHTASMDKEQSKRRRILEIIKDSKIEFLRTESKSCPYEFDVCVSGDIHFIELSELRDRARLINYANRIQNDLEQLRSIIHLVETIEMILKTLTEFHRTGYPLTEEFSSSKKIFECKQGNYADLDQFRCLLNTDLTEWDDKLCSMYEICTNLTYFTNQQIWNIEKILYAQTPILRTDVGYHLLKFIGIDPESIEIESLPSIPRNYRQRLENIASILNTFHHRTQTNFFQEDSQRNKQIFLVQASDNGFLRSIYSLFTQHKSPILANRLFFCTNQTTWIEIRAFIYRCFYSQTIHQLIQPEFLPLVVQDQFIELFNEFIENSPKHLFRLSIITTKSSSQLHLINGLGKHRNIEIINDEDLLTEYELEKLIQKQIGDRCMLVTSRIAGLGKSNFIAKQATILNKTRVKFSISGDINIEALIEQLSSEIIQMHSSEIILHINIGPIENIQEINEFLYSLVLFRCFSLGHRPVDVPVNIPIYIEFDSSSFLQPTYDKILIFKYLKTQHIDRFDWNDLYTDSSMVQFVANYLFAIRNRSIVSKTINEDTAHEPIQKTICIRLLKERFLPKKNPEFISWTQLSIYLKVYYTLFWGFAKCGYFMVDPKHLSTLRLDVLRAVIASSDQFTSLSVETVRRNQSAVLKNESVSPFSDAIICWEKTRPFTVIFTVTDNPLFIYKTAENIPKSLKDALISYFEIMNKNAANRGRPTGLFYSILNRLSSSSNSTTSQSPQQQLEEFFRNPNQMTHEEFFLQLTSLSTKYLVQKAICGKCFTQFEYNEKDCLVCQSPESVLQPASLDSADIEQFQRKIAAILHSQYVFTADSYIKMLLIYLRIQSNLPVLIMGETGCGKTALIQCLCQKILDDHMEVFHIHAGINNDRIIETMRNFIAKAKTYENKRLWIFFDEFNTTPSIGLLKEIICERRFMGDKLPSNMVFLGACNPQRRSGKKRQADETEGTRKYRSNEHRRLQGIDPTLLYSVVSIPETMLEHVWDYGYLDSLTERTYITAILNSCEQLKDNETWFACIIKLISKSQKYLRELQDVSSVSLRDVARFCRFYAWFYKHTNLNNTTDTNPSIFNRVQRASLLSLFLCYYFRLTSSKKRQEYLIFLINYITRYDSNVTLESISTLLHNEKMSLVDKMELPLGTAKNRALTDNIFVLFTCILNRIPVILSGRPGSSKTLAIQILISNLKGKKSKHPFFRDQFELIVISYQGSQSCTSESIIKVFEQAQKCTQLMATNEILPVIVFDEIGLAELSPHNPLKVLHNELEIENCRYGFVGLSNRLLDASKMNRAVYLACPKANEEDLIQTAYTLSISMLPEGLQTIPLDESIIKGLTHAYMTLYEHMKDIQKEYYFGLRDYYALIKGIVYDRIQNSNKNIYEIIHYHLVCNFDGTINGAQFMWSKFCEYTHCEHKINEYSRPTFDHLLDQCLSTTRTGRFLMLIGRSDSDFDFVQRYIAIRHPNIPTRTLIGSKFPGDFVSTSTYTEEYNTRVLMDIILHAEKNVTLFFRGLNHLYDNLYDLFNQNFAVTARKKYCRIALGSLYHPRCIIHDEFYCIVFVKQDELIQYDPPFLNRFEKHSIDMNYLIRSERQLLSNKFTPWIQSIVPSTNLFLWSNEYYLLNLTNEILEQIPRSTQSDDQEDLRTYFQHEILSTSSFDLPLLLSLQSKQESSQIIDEYYSIHNELSFSLFINQVFTKEKNPRLLIYTYTQIYEIINYDGIINHELWTEEVKLSHFKTELEFLQKLRTSSKFDNTRLIFIRIDYQQDVQHLPMLKHILLDEICGICLIFHMQRSKLINEIYFPGWTKVMIDDLENHRILPKTILMNPSYDQLVSYLDFLNQGMIFQDLIDQCFMKLRYTTLNRMYQPRVNNRRSQIIEHFKETNSSLNLAIKNHLLKIIQTKLSNSDWRQDLLSDTIITNSCRSINDALTHVILNFLRRYLSLLLSYYEKYSLIDSYLFLLESDETIRDKFWSIWFHCQTKINRKIDISLLNQNVIDIPVISDFHLPCITIEYEIINEIRQLIIQKQQDKDPIIEFASKELINRSIYGEFIKEIFHDSKLFNFYFHDLLTLAMNQANIHELSITFVQRLLTANTLNSVQHQLSYLFIDYVEFFEILRTFEIGRLLIGEEESLFEIFESTNPNHFRLVFENSKFYLIHPGHSQPDDNPFPCEGNPYIEVSLMNLLELLTSSIIIARIHSMQQLLTNYARVIQSITIVTRFGHYEINNLEKLTSIFRLASCLSTLYSDEKAFQLFKQIYHQPNFSIVFRNLNEIHQLINLIHQTIRTQKPIVSEKIIHQTLSKFECELIRNWLLDHAEQYEEIPQFINDHNLWNYSIKIINLIDKTFTLSDETRDANGQVTKMNVFTSQSSDPERKFQILLTARIYMQLIFDDDYQLEFDTKNKKQIVDFLDSNFEFFKENIQLTDRFELICSIAWIKYYLLYYIYALKTNVNDNIMTKIDEIINKNSSTIRLYLVKQLCQCENLSFHSLSKKYLNRTVNWLRSMIDDTSRSQKIILPTPLFQLNEEFKRITGILSNFNEIETLLNQCSTDVHTAYCFLMWFIHYYTRFYMSNVMPDNGFVEVVKKQIRKELIEIFEPIGYDLICSLCMNFTEQSYFHLSPSMPERDLHQRLLILNIIILLISLKSLKYPTLLSSLLFDSNFKMPKFYLEHFQTLSFPEQNTSPFLDLIRQSIFIFLSDCKLIQYDSTTYDLTYFESHFSTFDQCYIWFYKLLNCLVDKKFLKEDLVEDETKYERLRKLLEQKLIIPHSQSMIYEIKEYQLAYAYFIFKDERANHLINFVNELVENNQQYENLQFFNVTNIHSIDIIKHFSAKLQFQTNYPLTTFIFEHLTNFDQISYLYSIIRFINHLIQQYDYRIRRETTIRDCLQTDSDLKEILDDFRIAWNVVIDSEHPFSDDMTIATLKSNTNIIDCLQRLVNFQNELLNYSNLDANGRRVLSIQLIQKRDLFDFGTKKLRKFLLEKACLINCDYGMSREIIYDFDEIEWTLKNEINCLPKIEMSTIRFANFQGDFVDEIMCLINDIRAQFEQKLFDPLERQAIKRSIDAYDNDTILQLFSFIEYILTYLRNLNNQTIVQTLTLQTFIEKYIYLKAILQNKILNKKPFSSIHLNYIIDLYELIEECIFEKILSYDPRLDFNERTDVIQQFLSQTIDNQHIANCFQDVNCWINMFKRLLVRLLLPKIDLNFDAPLQDFVKRNDIWKGNITADNVRTIDINRDICLKHTCIILKYLEQKLNDNNEQTTKSKQSFMRTKSVSQRGKASRRD